MHPSYKKKYIDHMQDGGGGGSEVLQNWNSFL